MYQVQKRDGKIVEFDVNKISAAISKAFDAMEKQYHPTTMDMLALQTTANFEPKIKDGIITVEDIQDRSCPPPAIRMSRSRTSSTAASAKRSATRRRRCSTTRPLWTAT